MGGQIIEVRRWVLTAGGRRLHTAVVKALDNGFSIFR